MKAKLLQLRINPLANATDTAVGDVSRRATPIVLLGPAPKFDLSGVPVAPCLETTPRTEDGRVDGPSYCQSLLNTIRTQKHKNPSQPIIVAFDLDNTLFDTRARTLAVLHAFDAAHHTSQFKTLTLDGVGWNGSETCGALRLDEATTTAVQTWWDEHFWSGEHFGADLVMQEIFDMAWAAKNAGAEVRYLTGRIEALKDATCRQVQGAGLPDADDAHLFLKPDVQTATGPFKADALFGWLDDGAFLAWFMTDNRHEIESIRTAEQTDDRPHIPCVHVEHKLQRPGTIAKATPTYVEQTTERLLTPDAARRRAERQRPRRPTV